jgi:hypothetical protein
VPQATSRSGQTIIDVPDRCGETAVAVVVVVVVVAEVVVDAPGWPNSMWADGLLETAAQLALRSCWSPTPLFDK